MSPLMFISASVIFVLAIIVSFSLSKTRTANKPKDKEAYHSDKILWTLEMNVACNDHILALSKAINAPPAVVFQRGIALMQLAVEEYGKNHGLAVIDENEVVVRTVVGIINE